jgi:hypothetical protein
LQPPITLLLLPLRRPFPVDLIVLDPAKVLRKQAFGVRLKKDMFSIHRLAEYRILVKRNVQLEIPGEMSLLICT